MHPTHPSMSYPPLLFPQELVDLIIEHAAEDKGSLLSCALTCSSFYPASRRSLFSQIELDMHTKPNVMTYSARLNHALTRNPHLLPLIKSVVVKRMFAHERGSPCFLQQDSDSLEILLKLSHLRQLTLVGHIHKDWALLSPNLRTIIASICHSARLEHLTIDSLSNFPAHLLSSCLSLRQLELTSMSTLCHDSFSTVPNRISLESLALNYSDAFGLTKFVSWMFQTGCNVDLSRLRRLIVNVRRQHAYSWCVLASKTPFLEELEFSVIVPASSSPATFNVYRDIELTSFTSIRYLSINFRIQDLCDCDSLSWAVPQLLRSIPVSSPIERLVLSFSPVPSLRLNKESEKAPPRKIDIPVARRNFRDLRSCEIYLAGIEAKIESHLSEILKTFFVSKP
ncbi:hypothetical protein EST38_g8552 [Candolleomyces aberdarensis]|uniref:F-box domain-containing protein n=1 Tax=Candolleomyces aberdarensis TaxID=2316362 RepID=A0A4Q2DF37_9AGAR|nr:hypothetical protein EST38_g8552 [Candolleomyces aberdarensis]